MHVGAFCATRLVAAAVALAGCGFWAETGDAAVVASNGFDTATFTAAAGEPNRLTVKATGTKVTFRDVGAPITLAPGTAGPCAQTASGRVVCRLVDDNLVFVVARLGDGNDTAHVTGRDVSAEIGGDRGDDLLSATAEFVNIDGGAGNDRLTGSAGGEDTLDGGPGADRLAGGAGYDSLYGGSGPDLLQGQAGGDSLTGGPGRDDLRGGRGTDSAVYHVGRRPVMVTLDGLANDGEPGERDVIRRDIEGASVNMDTSGNAVAGTPSGSNLIGNAGPNELSVFGDATAAGRGGDDYLEGRGGLLLGDEGNDTLTAWGAGRFRGGPGNDTLTKEEGATGGARLYGDSGDDTIVSAEREQCEPPGRAWAPFGPVCSPAMPLRDRVRCGRGQDTVTRDSSDLVGSDCERTRRPARTAGAATASRRAGVRSLTLGR